MPVDNNLELKQYQELVLNGSDYWEERRQKALDSKTKAFSKSKAEKVPRFGLEKKLFELGNDKEGTLQLLNGLDLHKKLIFIYDSEQKEDFLLGNQVFFMEPLLAVLRSKNKHAIDKCFMEKPEDENTKKIISKNILSFALAAMRANALGLIHNNKDLNQAYQYSSVRKDFYSSLMEEDLDLLDEKGQYFLGGMDSLCVKQNHPEVIKRLALPAFSERTLMSSEDMVKCNRFLTELINNGYYDQATECIRSLKGKVLRNNDEFIAPQIKFDSIFKYWNQRKEEKPEIYAQFKELLGELMIYCEKFESAIMNLDQINHTYVAIAIHLDVLEEVMEHQNVKNRLLNKTEKAIAEKLFNEHDFVMPSKFADWLKHNPEVVSKIASHMGLMCLEKLYSNKPKKIEEIREKEYQSFMERLDLLMQQAQITWKNFSWSTFSEMMLKETASKKLTNYFEYEQGLAEKYETMKLKICEELTQRSISSHIKPVKEPQMAPKNNLNRF